MTMKSGKKRKSPVDKEKVPLEKVWKRKDAGEESICVILFKIEENLLLFYLLGCLVLVGLMIAFCLTNLI